jgi:hypothetical protein
MTGIAPMTRALPAPQEDDMTTPLLSLALAAVVLGALPLQAAPVVRLGEPLAVLAPGGVPAAPIILASHGDDDDDDDDDDRDDDDNRGHGNDDDRDDDDNPGHGSHDDDWDHDGRDRPRIPGGPGCDDPGDWFEHPECRVGVPQPPAGG